VKISKKSIFVSVVTLAAATIIFVEYFKTLAGNHLDQVQQELQKFLGKDVSFQGVEVSLWRGLGFSAREFRIADDSRFAATPFVRAKELRLGVSLWQLLLGRVFINSLTFQDAEFQIITNEKGLLNASALASRKKELGALPKLGIASPEKRHSGVSFDVSKIRVVNGRLDFIDRSVKEPAELKIKNIEMEASGLDPRAPTRIKFIAALAEGLTHDMRIEGVLGPLQQQREWSQQPMELEMQFDSLYLPSLARALPIIRNKIPLQLNLTGPMALEAKLAGTLQRPRVTNIILKMSLFGSSEYNAILKGAFATPEHGDWSDANLKGTLALERLNLLQLRGLPFLQQTLPATLVAEGPMSFSSRFEGTWNTLRVGASAEADTSDFALGDWLRKPGDYSVKLRAQISREKDRVVLHESTLSLGNSKMTLSGLIDNSANSKLRLKLRADRGPLTPWASLVAPISSYRATGSVDWDILLEKNFAAADGGWNMRGKLNLVDSELADERTGTKINHLNATVSFLGPEARIEKASFNLGSSQIAMAASMPDLTEPRANYTLSARELKAADLPSLPASSSIKLKNVSSSGEIQFKNGAALLKGTVVSTDGSVKDIPYRDLQADVAWLPVGMSVKNLSLRVFSGIIRSDGLWLASELAHRFELASQIESVDVQSLLAQTIPPLKNRLTGRLDFRGAFNAASENGALIQDVLKGSGEASIQKGTINDFNLLSQFLLRSNRGSRSPHLTAGLVALVDRRDTPFDSLKANFNIDRPGILTANLLLATPEYTISGAGWLRFDRTTKWNGMLLLSPGVTQELQREYKTLRYFVDRRGRLAVAFRVEGTLPNITIKPENRMLAQALRWSSSPAANESANVEQKERKNWVPRSLEKLLGR
jgi:uncharacterized protein involved in outer membrane biogenesis